MYLLQLENYFPKLPDANCVDICQEDLVLIFMAEDVKFAKETVKKEIEMYFLPDITIPCDACGGTRYNRETLEVKYKGKNISDVLKMTVEEALTFFENIPTIKNKIQALYDVGLGYIKTWSICNNIKRW